MKYTLQDLIDIEQFQALQDRLNEIYSFPSAIIDNDGKILASTGWQDVCAKFHRQNRECEQECIKSDQYILSHMAEANPAVSYRCPRGLVDNATPIIVDGEHLGNFFTGQFFLEEPDLEFFREQARRYGFDEGQYMEAVKKVPVWTQEKLESYLFFIKCLIEVISVTALKNLRAIEARQKSEESERNFQAMFDTASIGIAQADPRTGQLLRANQKMCSITGYTAEELLSLRFSEFTHPEDRGQDWEAFQRVIRGDAPSYRMEKRYIRKDGAVVWVNVNMTVIRDDAGQPVRTMTAIEDISERKRAEEVAYLLKQSIDLHRDGAYWTDCDGSFVYVNDAGCKVLGYEPGELTGKTIHDVNPSASAERMAAVWEKLRKEGVYESESTHRRKDGSEFPVEIITSHVQFDGREYACGFARDITERKRIEKDLAERESRLGALFDYAGYAISLACGGIQIMGNPAFINLFGYRDAAEVAGSPVLETIAPAERDRVVRYVADRTMGKEAPNHYETKGLRKDGSIFDMEVMVSTYTFNDRVYTVGFQRDITGRKRAEEETANLQGQLAQAQKMESVGRLAGGVAHDFNNMLAVILGHTEIALGQTAPGNPLHEDLEEIRKAAERSAELTRQLLTFARKQTVAPRVLDLNETVAGMIKMLQRLIGEDIQLEWHPSVNPWAVNMDPSQVDQILANLCVNARDAIDDVGKITIETENRTFDEDYCADHAGFAPGEYMMLAVSDNGCGMGKETLAAIFEPFFTTKGVGEGTGLGLATVYGAVRQNNGFINVYSEPGEGTTFSIYLPRNAGEAEEARPQGVAAPVPRGDETILLVEDETPVLNLTTRVLEGQGYTVLAARTPGEAIRIAREYPGEIHLLVTDVVMPEMNGRDLARHLSPRHPRLKQLFMSGYTANVIANHGVLDKGVHFIQKPFPSAGLAAKVREVLDSE